MIKFPAFPGFCSKQQSQFERSETIENFQKLISVANK